MHANLLTVMRWEAGTALRLTENDVCLTMMGSILLTLQVRCKPCAQDERVSMHMSHIVWSPALGCAMLRGAWHRALTRALLCHHIFRRKVRSALLGSCILCSDAHVSPGVAVTWCLHAARSLVFLDDLSTRSKLATRGTFLQLCSCCTEEKEPRKTWLHLCSIVSH